MKTKEEIKEEMVKYVNKVAHHHYQEEGKENRIVFVPFIKEDYCFLIELRFKDEDLIGIDSEASYYKRGFKEQIFITRRTYNKMISIRRYDRFDSIIEKAKSYIEEHGKDLQIRDYFKRREFTKSLLEAIK